MAQFIANWGIIGTGEVCNDFVVALKTMDPSMHQIISVAASTLPKAQTFANMHGIPEFCCGYDNLAKNKKINCFYVGLIHTEHFPVCKMLLEMGKNVLCEKPMCLTKDETDELIGLARSHGAFLMEGIWSRFFPIYDEVQRQIDRGVIGNVLQISANIGFKIDDIHRVVTRTLGGGVMNELGVYILQLVQLIFKNENFTDFSVYDTKYDNNLDSTIKLLLKFPSQKIALLSLSINTSMENKAVIFGTKGTIEIKNFWCPTEIASPAGIKTFELPSSVGPQIIFNSTGLCYEAEEVRLCLEKNILESPRLTWNNMKQLAHWRHYILNQIGITIYNGPSVC